MSDFPAETPYCAICEEYVDERSLHTKYCIDFGRRRGRIHAKCTPPDLNYWMEYQSRHLI